MEVQLWNAPLLGPTSSEDLLQGISQTAGAQATILLAHQALRAKSRYQGYRPCRSAASQQLQQAAPLLRCWRRFVALLDTTAVWAVPQ